ncbi:MAG: cytochrome c oxidase subunit II [Planctomycetota bacterium]
MATPLASIWQLFQPSAATGAPNVDWLFWFITWICILFSVLIFGLTGLFVYKYRARPGHRSEHSPHHNNTLELTWSVIPLIIVIFIFFYGFTGYLDMRTAPATAYEINVKAQKWAWAFEYPNGHVDTNRHVPMDTPVKLIMSSSDVLHSVYIPAFRVKMDCVPGKYTSLWFNATRATQDDDEDGLLDNSAGEPNTPTGDDDLDLFCTEYCGTGHSSMYAKVVVHEPGGFEKWMAKAVDPRAQGTPVEVGKKLYQRRGCAQCHSVNGVDNPANGGPSFKGHYGEELVWSKGPKDLNFQTADMDENYMRESILNPMAKIRKGYRAIMPTYQGQLSDDQVHALIQYIKSLNDATPDDWAPLPEQGVGDGEPEAGDAEGAAPAQDAAPAVDSASVDSAADAA